MADMKNLIVGNTTYNIVDDETFRIGGDAREGSCFYINPSSPYTPTLQLKRQNTSMLVLSIADNGYLELTEIPYVDGEDDWDHPNMLWSVQMRRLSNYNPIGVSSATVSSSYSGSCSYVKNGHLVIFGATIATTGALSNGTVLATGLPSSNVSNAPFPAQDNNASSGYSHLVVVDTSGNLKFRGTTAGTSANRSLRISGAYLSAS